MSSTLLARETLPESATRPSRLRRRLLIATAALALAAGAAKLGRDWWNVGRFIESTDDAYVGGNVTTIAPHIAGFITEILVTDNEHVQQGQMLARMDRRDFQAAFDRAQAVVDGKTATLTNIEAQLVLQQSVIRQAEADLSAKTAHASFAHQDAQRYASLATTNAGSRQDAQKTLASEQEAGAATLSSYAGLEASRQQVKVLDTQRVIARAAIAQAEADLQTARLNLGYTEIRSPVDGYIGNRAARVGAYAAEGAYLLSVIPAHGLWVDANFKEDQLAHLVPGQKATIAADVASGRDLHGHVQSVAPGTGAVFSVIPPENATGNFTKIVQRVPVRILLDDADATLGLLRPGLSTTVSVDTRQAP